MLDFTAPFMQELAAAKRIEHEFKAADALLLRRIRDARRSASGVATETSASGEMPAARPARPSTA